MKNKTAVDWLLEQFEFLKIRDKVFESDWNYFVETAKGLEKGQIENALLEGKFNGGGKFGSESEQYYKDTYENTLG